MAQKPFNETLCSIRAGVLVNELTEKLAAAVKAVEETGKSGELTLKLTIKKIARFGAIDIADKVTVKIPEDQPVTTLMFSTPEGNLVTEDPRQQKLELRAVPVPGAADVISLARKNGE